MRGPVVGWDEEGDPPGGVVDEDEFVEAPVYTPSVGEDFVLEPAQVEDLGGGDQSVEHLPLKGHVQSGGRVARLMCPSPENACALLSADRFVGVRGDQPQPVRAVPVSSARTPVPA